MFSHETNTFSKAPADLDAFRARRFFEGADIFPNFAGTNSEIAAFMDAAETHGWELVPTIATQAMPSGPVTADAFNYVRNSILAGLADGPYDAILLSLHGAMVSDAGEDGEGTLLQSIRDMAGPKIPIAVTLDLHANVTVNMARLADIMVSYRTYPHVDQYETGKIAADLLARTLDGEIRPQVLLGKREMLDGADHGRTPGGPMRDLLPMARRLEAEEPGVLAVSINGGFPWADTLETGPSVIAVVDGETKRHHDLVADMMQTIWDRREELSINLIGTDTAVRLARESNIAGKPIVLAEFSDNPGGGGYGDATRLLAALVDGGVSNAAFSLIVDPDAADTLYSTVVGNAAEVTLGGKSDISFGAPLRLEGQVIAVSDGNMVHDGPMNRGVAINLGKSALFRVGGIDIVVTSRKAQVYDLQHFRFLGAEPADYDVLVVKSAHHFRAAFEPIARAVELVDAGGLTSRNYRDLPYRRVRRPVYPLDMD
jgi:microcystin degradation protein MlrC